MRIAGTSIVTRRGAVALTVIVLLILIGILCGALVRGAAAGREQLRQEERRAQADWLAEAGLERAAAKLAGAGDYRGETWRVPAAELGGSWEGVVQIRVEADGGRHRVRAEATYPADSPRGARRTKRAIVTRTESADRGEG